MSTHRKLAAGCVTVAMAVSSCAVFTDLDDLSSGSPATGADAAAPPGSIDGGGDAPTEPAPPALGARCANGGVCAVAPPDGWTFAAARFGEGPDCPAGFSGGTDRVELGDVPEFLCDCSCGPPLGPGPSCTTGSVKVAGSGGCFGFSTSISASGACVDHTVGGPVRFAPAAVQQSACGAEVGRAAPPPAPTKPARSCAVTVAPVADGCDADRRCVPPPSGSYGLCLVSTRPGAECPPSYPRRHVLGTSVQDGRSCSDCACETSATCTNARVELYEDHGCLEGSEVFPADDLCHNQFATFHSAIYRADLGDGACKVSAETITGKLSLEDEVTLCCPGS